MSEELKPCPWCGHKLVLAGKHFFICENGYCLISNHALTYETWQNAYCWKELLAKDEKIKKLRDALKAIPHDSDIGESGCASWCMGCVSEKILRETADKEEGI